MLQTLMVIIAQRCTHIHTVNLEAGRHWQILRIRMEASKTQMSQTITNGFMVIVIYRPTSPALDASMIRYENALQMQLLPLKEETQTLRARRLNF